MKAVVLDTNILIDYASGHASWLNIVLKSGYELIIPTIMVTEYLQAPSLENKKNIKVADRTFKLFKKQDLNEEIARLVAKTVRRKTYPPGADLVDLIIASTAIYLDAALATGNKKHFAGIPDLRFFDLTSVKK